MIKKATPNHLSLTATVGDYHVECVRPAVGERWTYEIRRAGTLLAAGETAAPWELDALADLGVIEYGDLCDIQAALADADIAATAHIPIIDDGLTCYVRPDALDVGMRTGSGHEILDVTSGPGGAVLVRSRHVGEYGDLGPVRTETCEADGPRWPIWTRSLSTVQTVQIWDDE